jgi:arylsulfatase
MNVWRMPLTPMRAPIVIDLKTDPYEYAWDASAYWEGWFMQRAYLVLPAVSKVSAYLATYRDFPPRQHPASFSIDQVIEKLESATKSK